MEHGGEPDQDGRDWADFERTRGLLELGDGFTRGTAATLIRLLVRRKLLELDPDGERILCRPVEPHEWADVRQAVRDLLAQALRLPRRR